MNWHSIIEWIHAHVATAHEDVLFSILILFAMSAFVVGIVQKLKQSTVIGYLLTGFLIGPHFLGLIGDVKVIDTVAMLGVILLMFTLGIEFPLKKLLRIRTIALGGGALQVLLTIGVVMPVAHLMHRSLFECIFLGCLVAMSSSVIVLKLLTDRGELDAPYAKISIGILIFQDLCVVPIMILLPAMGGASHGGILVPILAAILKAAIFLGVAVVLAEIALPKLLYYVASTKSKELFLITVITLCLGTAWITSRFGLSLALGAFLAGLLLADSEYSHEIFSDVLPFKDSFLCIFFISVGMLLNPVFVWHKFGMIAVIVAMILFGKLMVATIVVRVFRHSLRTALLVGFSLSQIGEFSFVLVKVAYESGFVDNEFYNVIIASAITTMLLTPALVTFAHWLCDQLARRNWMVDFAETDADARLKEVGKRMSNHVVVCGYGPIGRNLGRSLRACQVPFIAIELNPATVLELGEVDTPVFYGDASSERILKMAGIERAAAVAVTIPDPVASRMIVKRVRKLNPQVRIIARAKYARDMADLKALGAHEVIHEEFEASLEVIVRALQQLGVPLDAVHRTVQTMREERAKSKT